MPELTVNPNETSVLLNVAVSNLGPNPFRDMKTFPIQEDKIASLKESIGQTGFWPCIVARPENNVIDGKPVTQAELDSLIAADSPLLAEVKWEKAFAHHRQAACEALGFATIPITPRILDDDAMLLMMANENKEGFGSNIFSQLETVRQVSQSIDEMLEKYPDYDSYTEDYPKKADRLFTSKQSFTQATENGTGYRIVKKFLGETWSDADVRIPMEALDYIHAGAFLQEDCLGVKSITIMHALAKLALFIRVGTPETHKTDGTVKTEAVPAPNWPDYIKDRFIDELIEKASPDDGSQDVKITVSVLKAALKAVKDNGVNPVAYVIRRQGKTEFDVYAELKKEFIDVDKTLAENLASIASMRKTDGLGNWSEIEEMIKKLTAAAERLDKGEADDAEEGEGLEPTAEGDVNAALGNDETGDGAEPDSQSAFSGTPETGPLPVNQATQRYVESCEAMASYAEDLLNRVGEVQIDEGDAAVIQNMLNKVSALAFKTLGKVALTSSFNAATKE